MSRASSLGRRPEGRGLASFKPKPEDDRPREKLLKKGAGALSNSELLAILLRTGTNGVSSLELARKILNKFGTFRNMAHTDTCDWKELISWKKRTTTTNNIIIRHF